MVVLVVWNNPSLLISLTSKFELALINLVNCEGWLPIIGYFNISLPRSPIIVFLFWLISPTLSVSLKNYLPGSTLITAGVGNL